MSARSVNSAAGVILAAMQQKQTAAGIALALEAAGLLMSPEAAADIAKVSTDAVRVAEESVAELKREHEESARLRTALRKACDEVARLEAELGGASARISELEAAAKSSRVETIADVGDWLDENGQKDAAYLVYTVDIPVAREMRVVSLEDPHDSPLHHRYLLGRDLPPLGGVS